MAATVRGRRRPAVTPMARASTVMPIGHDAAGAEEVAARAAGR